MRLVTASGFQKFKFHVEYLVRIVKMNGSERHLSVNCISLLVVSGVDIWVRVGCEVGPDSAYRFFVMRDAANPMEQCLGAHICERATFVGFGTGHPPLRDSRIWATTRHVSYHPGFQFYFQTL